VNNDTHINTNIDSNLTVIPCL